MSWMIGTGATRTLKILRLMGWGRRAVRCEHVEEGFGEEEAPEGGPG